MLCLQLSFSKDLCAVTQKTPGVFKSVHPGSFRGGVKSGHITSAISGSPTQCLHLINQIGSKTAPNGFKSVASTSHVVSDHFWKKSFLRIVRQFSVPKRPIFKAFWHLWRARTSPTQTIRFGLPGGLGSFLEKVIFFLAPVDLLDPTSSVLAQSTRWGHSRGVETTKSGGLGGLGGLRIGF